MRIVRDNVQISQISIALPCSFLMRTISQISFALLTGLVARANHLFYRFRTAFCVRNGIATLYESYYVRLIYPPDFMKRARIRVCVCVSSYRALFLYFSTRIRNNSAQFHLKYKYGIGTTNYYNNSFWQSLFLMVNY